jgi:hypothetical protein
MKGEGPPRIVSKVREAKGSDHAADPYVDVCRFALRPEVAYDSAIRPWNCRFMTQVEQNLLYDGHIETNMIHLDLGWIQIAFKAGLDNAKVRIHTVSVLHLRPSRDRLYRTLLKGWS